MAGVPSLPNLDSPTLTSMREQILSEIRRTAAENGGTPLGREAFERATGIRYSDWFGKLWTRWGDAVREAGLEPNQLIGRIPDDEVLRKLAELTRRLGKAPTTGDLRMEKRRGGDVPNDKVLARFGTKGEMLERLRLFCMASGSYSDVVDLLPTTPSRTKGEHAGPVEEGFVYLLRSGRNYKIGRTNAVGRREYELAIQLPDRAEVIHRIRTDDPVGIETYWHNRFAAKHTNGEWFKLSSEDVKAFKRRKYQ